LSIYTDILFKYWGYNEFRNPQDIIIESIASGKDTLGLMPTGGGKSITFQVYSMSVEGVCLVVTPLIALMKDQVENLKKKKIKAAAIYSGMTKYEIEITLNNVINGGYKFLYISPERLKNYYFKQMMKNMNVNLITIDEAHCISQWGYDFRPSYLEIVEIREMLPDIPVLALTATATPEVVLDIQNKLNFKEYNVIQKSFERKNLIYSVAKIEDKINILFRLLNKVPGSGVIYVRNRKKTKEYALLLQKFGVAADFYHAGLESKQREEKQNDWQNNKIRIMVCTNAFGMGIDKPDVRLVVHLDLPDSLEAYFQEAGRAGRDGKKANAFLLFNGTDVAQLKKNLTMSFPDLKKVENIYNDICSYLKIPFFAGEDTDFTFDVFDFVSKFHYDVVTTINSLKLLEISEILSYDSDVNSTSRIMIACNRDELYSFQIFSGLDDFLKTILRTYTGVFTDFVNISEDYLAKILNITPQKVYELLKELNQRNIINFIPKSKHPIIHFFVPRPDDISRLIDDVKINEHKQRIVYRLESMLSYATSSNKCRSQQLLSYFGEKNTKPCGHCDICNSKNSLGLTKYEFETIGLSIKNILSENPELLRDLVNSITDFESNKVAKVVQWCLDNSRIEYDKERKLRWIKN
jgi:ATP-dependent DNA helicase RecQ